MVSGRAEGCFLSCFVIKEAKVVRYHEAMARVSVESGGEKRLAV